MKFILLEHAEGNDPWQLRIFETAEARITATVEAILGPGGKREDAADDLSTLEEDRRLDFEGDPSLEWIDAEVPEYKGLVEWKAAAECVMGFRPDPKEWWDGTMKPEKEARYDAAMKVLSDYKAG